MVWEREAWFFTLRRTSITSSSMGPRSLTWKATQLESNTIWPLVVFQMCWSKTWVSGRPAPPRPGWTQKRYFVPSGGGTGTRGRPFWSLPA